MKKNKTFDLLTGYVIITGIVKFSAEKLQADDGVEYDHKENEKGDVKKRYDSSKYGVDNHLETY